MYCLGLVVCIGCVAVVCLTLSTTIHCHRERDGSWHGSVGGASGDGGRPSSPRSIASHHSAGSYTYQPPPPHPMAVAGASSPMPRASTWQVQLRDYVCVYMDLMMVYV